MAAMLRERVRWGILGSGGIAREFLRGCDESDSGVVEALATRGPVRPELESNFPGLKIHDSYESLLADPQIDAVYVATPHPFHARWAIAAAARGKHVLTEKPAGMDAGEVEQMFAAARRHNTFLGEAYMYRLHPLTAKILALLKQGKIGEVRMIKSSFGFAMPALLPEHRIFKKELGGGAILDVGGYPMSMARLIAGWNSDGGVSEPDQIIALLRYGVTDVDEISAALVSFPNGVLAQLSCSVSLWQDNVLHIQGTVGRLEIDSFWFGSGKHGGKCSIRFIPIKGASETIEVTEPRNVYSFQFEAANEAIRSGKLEFMYPGMTEADSLGNAVALERWLETATRCEPPVTAAQSLQGAPL